MSADFYGVNPTRMKLEVRHVDYNRAPTRKISGGATFASKLGGILGPIASIAGVFFPPLFAVGAAAYGMKGMANQSIAQQQAYINAEQAAHQQRGPQMISYMGYDNAPANMLPVSTSHPGIAPGQDPVMNILMLRQEASQQAIHTNYRGP